MAFTAPEADGTVLGARQDEADAGALREQDRSPGQRASMASSGMGSGVSTKYTNAFGPAETTRIPSRSHASRTSR